MKKLLLIIALAVIAGLTYAQVQISVGPAVGLNYNMHSIKVDGVSMDFEGTGLLFSGQVDVQFSRSLAILGFVDFYSNLSAKTDVDGMNYSYQCSYLSIAPTFKYCISRSHFYLYAGPGIGFNLKGRYEDDLTVADIEDMNMRFDLRLGAGYDFFLKNKLALSPFISYQIGLNDVAKDSSWSINTLQVGVALKFTVN